MAEDTRITPQQDLLAPFWDTAIRLFIRDQQMAGQLQQMLSKTLKFTNVTTVTPGKTGPESVEKLTRLLITDDAHILFSPPQPGKDAAGEGRLEALRQFLLNVQARMRQAGRDEQRIARSMPRLVPLWEEAENYQMRMKYLMVLAEFRMTSAFIFPFAQSNAPQEQAAERLPVLKEYLEEYFTGKEERLEQLDKKKSEEELTVRKQQADKLMKQGEDYKKSGNWEEAVQCFNKAIDLMPEDPNGYLESGRGYTKLKKYGRAIQRFTEAEDIADNIPLPNQEIANVRIAQVKEMVAQGADPDGAEVNKLLGEAMANYKTAINKAEMLAPLSTDDPTDRAAEAISNIASSIFKHELAESLGSRHSMVKELGGLARQSLQGAVKDGEAVTLPTSQLICLALAHVDQGEFGEAEKLLFRAAEDKKYLLEASRELNYMGTQIRKSAGPAEAVSIYNKILSLDPPNKAAVHYNLAVAYYMMNNKTDAAGEIVQAVYTDPSLPTDDLFYKNEEVVHLMESLIGLFAKVKENHGKIVPRPAASAPADAPAMFTPAADPRFAAPRDRFVALIAADRAKAYRLLYDMFAKSPDFLRSAEVYSSEPIMTLAEEVYGKVKEVDNDEIRRFSIFLSGMLEKDRALMLPEDSSHAPLRKEIEALIRLNPAGAIRRLFEAVSGRRHFLAGKLAFESDALAAFAAETVQKYEEAAESRVRLFVAALRTYLQRRERFLASAPSDDLHTLERILGMGPGAAPRLGPLFANNPTLLDTPEAYASETLAALASSANADVPPALAAPLKEYARTREKFLQYARYSSEALEVLMATADQRKMANSIAKAIYAMPEVVDKQYFYENGDIVSASKEICMKLQGLALRHI